MYPVRLNRLKIAKTDIIALFANQPAKIFLVSEIARLLSEHRRGWRLTDSTTIEDFLSFLLDNSPMQKVKIDFPHRPLVRYTWGEVPLLELVLSLKPGSYLSHYTAVYLHDLTEQLPKTIYLNYEQRRKFSPTGSLQQSSVDRAFQRPMRTSKNLAIYRDYRIYLLNSMGGDNLGIIASKGPQNEPIRLTNVERTLIDIAVRPGYSGGVFEVLKAYRGAKGKTSINRLVAILKQLNYVYPYHQVIGFYLDRSGCYEESSIDLLRNFRFDYDFYLTYGMEHMEYSPEWRLFFPKGF